MTNKEAADITRQLDMWADALGVSKDDVKKCKIKAIDELLERESSNRSSDNYKYRYSCKDCPDAGTPQMASDYLHMICGLIGCAHDSSRSVNIHIHINK